jgi:hypothetical protein
MPKSWPLTISFAKTTPTAGTPQGLVGGIILLIICEYRSVDSKRTSNVLGGAWIRRVEIKATARQGSGSCLDVDRIESVSYLG